VASLPFPPGDGGDAWWTVLRDRMDFIDLANDMCVRLCG